MKKISLIIIIFCLIIITTLTKNSSKKLENEIFEVQENLNLLRDQYELIKLENNFLSSPEKLINYKSQYFQNNLERIDIRKIKRIIIDNEKIVLKKININNNEK